MIHMEFSEEQIRDILELKERINKQIEKHKEEIEYLEKNLSILNSVLRESSFAKASSLTTKKLETESSIPIKKDSAGPVIADAFVTPEQVSIVLKDNVGLHFETPPFKSFFLDRIIGGMKRKDFVDAQNGRIQKDSVIECIVNKNGTTIREIIVKNYREKERINEIINTAAWSLARMIENSNQ